MRENSLRENRESHASPAMGMAGRPEKAMGHTAGMNDARQSDGCVVPAKRPNKGGHSMPPAEAVEGRQPAMGNAPQAAALRTQCRERASTGLQRVRKAARRDKAARFTALLHHVNIDLLRESFHALKKHAAPGIDGMTWQQYEVELESRLRDLHARVHHGTYRAQPSKRTYIPKADGTTRPLGIAALEDKLVQHALVTVLNAIYEADFKGFSYGFRLGRSQHDALDALWVGVTEKRVNWVLDADIRSFFDTIQHEWLLKFLEHRIADPRVLRLIRKWLTAGVSEDGEWSKTDVGTPQGAVVSPLLANVFLHYAFDLWVEWWRKKHARGDVIVVRYADDFVMGFQHRAEAEQCLNALRERMGKFGLALHPDKTRLIEFGRYAIARRAQRQEGKPETFNFLGFTHICAKRQKDGGFIVRRQTIAKRLAAKVKQVREKLMQRLHESIRDQGQWLCAVVRGYLNYHAVPGNKRSLAAFIKEAARSWLHALRRRSQKHRMTWARMWKLVGRWFPKPRTLHPYPNARFHAKHP